MKCMEVWQNALDEYGGVWLDVVRTYIHGKRCR